VSLTPLLPAEPRVVEAAYTSAAFWHHTRATWFTYVSFTHLLLSCSGGNYLADGTSVLVGGDAYAGPGYRSGGRGVRLLKAPNFTDWFGSANFTMPPEVQLKAPRW
jgi:hypothetical protein